jgi:glutamate/tyrosine decarboxylase-like PLP-dependent enzyme
LQRGSGAGLADAEDLRGTVSAVNEWDELLGNTAKRAGRYLSALPRRRVTPTDSESMGLDRLAGDLPEAGLPADEVLALLDEAGSPATVATAGGRYFGFVIGSALPAAVAADWLATAWDQNGAMSVMSPTAARLEGVALEWVRQLFGLPDAARGAFVTGDTMANLTCLAAARHAVLTRAGWDVGRSGLAGAPPITIIVGEEVHVSVVKALSLLGFGRDRLVRVPVDEQGRMRSDRLPAVDGPTIVCTQVGNVNSGCFDPVGAISKIARAAGAWVHVDGAFGLWARASPQYRALAEGVELADSWATDCHKMLNVPYDCGIAFARPPDALRSAMSMPAAAYLATSDEGEPMDRTPEMSRRARGVACWAALRSLGRGGVAALVDQTGAHARAFARSFREAGFSVLNDVVLNQVLVSFGSDLETRRVVEGLQQDGTCWAGTTVWHGTTAMRLSVSSWATTESDVRASIDAILRVARS